MLRETGLYYLQSRYYNPEWGRFLNADGLLSSDNLVGLNLYAYCNNNPVNYFDKNGKFAISSFLIASIIGGAIAGCVIGTASYFYTNEDPTVGGALLAATVGTVVGGLGGAAGAIGGKVAVGLSLIAGGVSGGYTFFTTDGPTDQKISAGVSSFAATFGGTYLATMIPLDKIGFGMTVAGNVIFGMTVGGYFEGANVWVQKGIADTFEKGEQAKYYRYIQENLVPYFTNPIQPPTVPKSISIYP